MKCKIRNQLVISYLYLATVVLKEINLAAVIRNGEYIQDYSTYEVQESDKLLLNTSLIMLETLRSSSM